MPGKRRPMEVNLSVVDGGKHWTKSEIEDREASEINMPKPKALSPPRWLSEPAKKLFRKYAKQLLALPEGMVSTLDAGTLARHCDCELSYADASQHKSAWMETCNRILKTVLTEDYTPAFASDVENLANYKEAEEQVAFWTSQMVKCEKICRSCATEMGMTISSRCRLVVPKPEQPQDNPLDALQKKFLSG